MNAIYRIAVMGAWIAAAAFAPAGRAANLPNVDLGAIFGAGKDIATAAAGVTEKEEVLIGRDLAGQILGAAELVNDRRLQAYVNRVGRWVASQGERPNLPWHFGVIESSGINAFAAPGGYILITRGLYELLDNESQLAGVLGHEIGHVIKQHHVKAMQQGNLLNAGAKLGQAALDARGSAGRTMVGNILVPNIADVFAKGLDRGSELEADQIGVVLAMRAGYSPSGLIEVLQKLQARSSSDPSLAVLFATHPAPADRMQALGQAMTPVAASLPEGVEPSITRIAVAAPPPRAGGRQATPPGTRALAADAEPAAPPANSGTPGVPGRAGGSGSGMGIDPSQLLRGIFGR